MHIQQGDIVKLRDGRLVEVTYNADQDPEAWRLYDEAYYDRTGEFRIVHEYTPETIFIGRLVGTERTVVSDRSEIVSKKLPV